ncbi:MAG: MFS transporter, partial [Spirochaetales bacterium]|nr:MFS transporter [Spirochaetales bacterium]
MKTRVWNRDFVLLWQGQLVSSVGDVAFQIGLGFWILRETGSSAIMGTVLALSTAARVLFGPIGGVFADRWNRKLIIIGADLLCGLVVTVGAFLAYSAMLEVWMVMVGSVLIGLSAAFFKPAVGASIPDLVPPAALMKGNSAFALIQTVSGVVGNTVGGVIYGLLGAPLLFLINGITYFVSSLSESFIRIPSRRKDDSFAHKGRKRTSFREELRDGLAFVWNQPVLRLLFLNVGMLNLLLTIGSVLLVPYFERSEIFAAADYGLTMAVLTGGSLSALVLLQVATLQRRSRFTVFAILAVAFGIARSFLVSIPALPVILTFAAIAGFAVAVINAFIISTIQEIAPAALRGNVMGLLGTFSSGLMPVGLAVGGILGDLFPITTIIPITGLLATVGFIPLIVSRPVA